jgi:hypothetical protein
MGLGATAAAVIPTSNTDAMVRSCAITVTVATYHPIMDAGGDADDRRKAGKSK